MKAQIVISKENPASQNIKNEILKIANLKQKEEEVWIGENFELVEYPQSILEIEPKGADYYIFASTHKSEKGIPALTVHTPGNWGAAEHGGKPKTLNIAYPSKIKLIADYLNKRVEELPGWRFSLEADHHGPTISKPIIFVEIGSTEKEWRNPKAGEIVAHAIINSINSDTAYETYIGFGGNHYAPKFSQLILNKNIAFGHIISSYALEDYGIDEERVEQAFKKNLEKPIGAILDWKGIKKEKREELIKILQSLSVGWRRE